MFHLLGAEASGGLRLWALIASLTILALTGARSTSAQVVAQYDFESGVQGWTGFNGATVQASTAAAQWYAKPPDHHELIRRGRSQHCGHRSAPARCQPDCLNHGPFYNALGKNYAREFAPQEQNCLSMTTARRIQFVWLVSCG
jgi:hypothetical protein